MNVTLIFTNIKNFLIELATFRGGFFNFVGALALKLVGLCIISAYKSFVSIFVKDFGWAKIKLWFEDFLIFWFIPYVFFFYYFLKALFYGVSFFSKIVLIIYFSVLEYLNSIWHNDFFYFLAKDYKREELSIKWEYTFKYYSNFFFQNSFRWLLINIMMIYGQIVYVFLYLWIYYFFRFIILIIYRFLRIIFWILIFTINFSMDSLDFFYLYFFVDSKRMKKWRLKQLRRRIFSIISYCYFMLKSFFRVCYIVLKLICWIVYVERIYEPFVDKFLPRWYKFVCVFDTFYQGIYFAFIVYEFLKIYYKLNDNYVRYLQPFLNYKYIRNLLKFRIFMIMYDAVYICFFYFMVLILCSLIMIFRLVRSYLYPQIHLYPYLSRAFLYLKLMFFGFLNFVNFCIFFIFMFLKYPRLMFSLLWYDFLIIVFWAWTNIYCYFTDHSAAELRGFRVDHDPEFYALFVYFVLFFNREFVFLLFLYNNGPAITSLFILHLLGFVHMTKL